MLQFIKTENTRRNFGQLFDYFIEKDWARNYFRNSDDVEKCLQLTRAFSREFERNVGQGDESLADLFYVPEFVDSQFCTDLLEILIKGLLLLPTYNLKWEKNGTKIGDNFLFTEVYESDKLQHYYILNSATYDLPYLLVNKETGSVLNMYIADIFPSKEINKIYGQFYTMENIEHGYYQLVFPLNDVGNEILNLEYKPTPLDFLITIPKELEETAYIGYSSPIHPQGTNVNHTIEELSDEEDVLFRNRIISLLEQDAEVNDIDLPF